jgi:DNA-binding protein YbaB
MEPTAWLEDYRRRVREIGHRARSAQTELAAVEATATSRDGAVTVTVTPAGALQRLVLGERAEGLTRIQLADTVLATVRRAHAEAAERAAQTLAPLVGDRSEAMRLLRSQLPVPEDTAR